MAAKPQAWPYDSQHVGVQGRIELDCLGFGLVLEGDLNGTVHAHYLGSHLAAGGCWRRWNWHQTSSLVLPMNLTAMESDYVC